MGLKAIGTLAAVITIAVIALVTFPVIGSFIDQGSGVTFQQTNVRLDSGVDTYAVSANDEQGINETVFLTRGNAIRLTGASDSQVQSTNSLTFASGGDWTLCTWAQVNTSVSGENMTAVSADGRAIIQYNDSDGNWSAWYFNESSRDSYFVEMNAPDQPGNLTHVCALHNTSSTTFTIFRNNTQGPTEDTSVSKSEDQELNATNWHGIIEETRVFEDPLNSSQRAALLNEPSQPLTNASRTARMMYDEGRGSTTFIIFADVDAEVTNGTWVSGHPQITVSSGSDYSWSEDGPQLTVLAGGELADAPIAYVDYDAKGLVRTFGEDFAGVLDLLPVVLLAMIAGMVVMVIREFG